MRTALVIAARDLRSRLRDRSVLISALAAPYALALILTLALSGSGDFTTSYGLVVEDDGAVGEAFTAAVTGPEVTAFAEVTRYDSTADAEQALADGDVRAAWVVPAGLSAQVQAGGTAAVEIVTTPAETVTADVAESIATGFAADVQARGLALRLGADPEDVGATAPAITMEQATAEEATDVAASYFGPAMATFFVYFLIAMGPRSLLRERRQGTLVRVLSAPVSPRSVLLGKAIGVVVSAFAALVVLWLATTAMLGADWGHPLGVLGISAAFVLAAAAIAASVMTVATTEKQVEGLVSIVAFTFALLGGNFFHLSEMPAVMRTLSRLTPNGWAMDGFSELIAGASVTSILPNVAVLLGIAVAFTALALPRTAKVVTP
ncbi:ABC transporter permease [Euzebya sp.]|uniref:ABC transporter permease n=1 Tax=Euzebya sp. TaxID=1971409 RepID=UPI003513DE7E